jgi:uncharacterized metal-binding protein
MGEILPLAQLLLLAVVVVLAQVVQERGLLVVQVVAEVTTQALEALVIRQQQHQAKVIMAVLVGLNLGRMVVEAEVAQAQ